VIIAHCLAGRGHRQRIEARSRAPNNNQIGVPSPDFTKVALT
jgi:hypothetical protein